MGGRRGWKFEDLITTEVYILPTNPDTDKGSNSITKAPKFQATAATYKDLSGQVHTNGTLIQLAPYEQEMMSYSGNVYTQAEYEAWETWVNKSYPFLITDDLNRTQLVYLEFIEFSRVRSRQHPWKHSYQVQGWVLGQIEGE